MPLLRRERQLLSDEQVDSCKNGYNTWAFVGDINSQPQLNCVFQSDDAQNEFLSNPKVCSPGARCCIIPTSASAVLQIGLGEDIYDSTQAGPGAAAAPDSAPASK